MGKDRLGESCVREAYEPRKYRELFSAQDVIYFRCAVGQTDLQVGVGFSCPDFRGKLPEESFLRDHVSGVVLRARRDIENYIATHPEFLTSLIPVIPRPWAPPIVRWMCACAAQAGVGPMAAVAGAISETVGITLLSEDSLSKLWQREPDIGNPDGHRARISEVIVENGGDVFIASSRLRRVGIYAGPSPLSGKIALEIAPGQTPCGICTSSGTVGHSRSFGRCDGAVIVAKDTALADAVATRVANVVKSREDIEEALDTASKIPGIVGAVIVIGDALGAWGDIKLAPA